MKVQNMSYREWQKRNTDSFRGLSKAQQKSARERGYRNVGWASVQSSWGILREFHVPTLFNAKLKRGDVLGALDQSILEAEESQKLAQKAIADLEEKRHRSREKAQDALNKYQLL